MNPIIEQMLNLQPMETTSEIFVLRFSRAILKSTC
jgi:hypothetical protein